MKTITEQTDEFSDTRKFIKTLSSKDLDQFDKDYLVDVGNLLIHEMKKALEKIKDLEIENQKLSSRLEEQIIATEKPVNKYEGYPSHKDYIAKLVFILSQHETDMTFEDITSAFFKLEDDLDEKWRNPRKSISKIISRACQFKVVNRKKVYGEKGCYAYGLI